MLIEDPLEMEVARILDEARVAYIHESSSPHQRLDFYLPAYGVYIECKAYSTDRTAEQIKDKKVIVLQTMEAVKTFGSLCRPAKTEK